MSQPEFHDAGGEPIDRDLLCVRCCYNLRMQTSAGICPNCGLAVADSLSFDRAQPPLAAGCPWLVRGATLMVVLGIVNFCVHGASNVTSDVYGRQIWQIIFDPAVALARVADIVMLAYAVLCFARSRLSPPELRDGMPLTGVLRLGVLAMAATTASLAGLNLLEFPLGVHLGLHLLRLRYLLFLLQTLSDVPMLICGLIYFRNLARRPEFSGFRNFVLAMFCVDIFFTVAFGFEEAYLQAVLHFIFRPPSAAFWNVTRTLDWVELAPVVPEVIFWWMLARRARHVQASLAPHPPG